MNTSTSNKVVALKRTSDTWWGVTYLGLNLIISVGAQLLLKAAMLELGAFEMDGNWGTYLLNMLNIEVIGGLILYGLGTILWILCLSKLDLGLAYPAGTLQYLLIFVGAWWLFDEQISILRLCGLLIICVGIFIMSFDLRKR